MASPSISAAEEEADFRIEGVAGQQSAAAASAQPPKAWDAALKTVSVQPALNNP